MKITDANVILRYLLKDDEQFFNKATEIIENNTLLITNEIAAEIVYVLEKVYKVPKSEIRTALTEFFNSPSIIINDKKVILTAFELFDLNNLDFVDAILLAYNHLQNYKVFTFDKKLDKLLKSNL
ncbi:MAG: type II toxin-antitoxin system VapC family toxin [Ignavibacteria bacterium]|nr:type II toxin-antitoxin system VapC family toxin [Ignavibacteria bacterium]